MNGSVLEIQTEYDKTCLVSHRCLCRHNNYNQKRALTNYAMFQIPLALLLTLESIGPLYSLPLALIIQKECPSFRASFGAILAVSGIALLSSEGRQDQ